MNIFVRYATIAWIHVMRPIWSVIVNSLFWVFHPYKFNEISDLKKSYAKMDLRKLMKSFTWKQDNYKDWIPWASTIMVRDLTDDCDGAASLAKWRMKQHGVDSTILNLYSADGSFGHCICMVKGNTFFVSNESVIDIQNTDRWKEELLAYFDGRYSIIL